MTRTYCDLCDAELNGSNSNEQSLLGESWFGHHYDLCIRCRGDVVDYIEGKRA